LKEKRKELDQKFNENSSSIKANFMNALQDINDKISKGMSLHPIFEELKNLQNDFKKATMTLSDKRNVWDKLDAAFKVVKEKRFGSKEGKSSDQNNVKDRLNNRYNGLLTAISKMEQSIDFDKKDIDFQTKKMDGQVGQLELQIRQAKLKMIEERIQSKQAKLADMVATKLELEQRKEKIEKSEAARAEKEEAKKVIQDKIAAEIKAASDSRTDNADDLEKAAQKIAESKQRKGKPKDDSILDTLQSNISETVEDVVDTVKAVSSVIGDKIGDLVDDITAKAADILEGKTDEDNTSVASEEQQESVSENPIAEDLGNTENTDIKEETSENIEDEEEKA
jgi:DNA repair exonuclease SbcCD ATPase subunit